MNAISTVSADVAKSRLVDEAASTIRSVQGRMVEDVVEIGQALIKAKQALGHGNFTPWLKAEFDWTERTAQNFMAVAERLGADPKRVSHLPLKTVYALASPSTPEPVRERLVARLSGGDVVPAEQITHEIREARREALRERDDAKKSPAARKAAAAKRQREAAEREKLSARIEAGRTKQDAARKAAATLIVEKISPDDLDRLIDLLGTTSGVTGTSVFLHQRDLIEARSAS